MKKFVAFIIILGSLLVLGGFVGAYALFFALPVQPLQNPMERTDTSASLLIEVNRGESLQKIARKLESAQLIRQTSFFVFFARVLGYGNKLKVGEYELNASLTGQQILEILSSGRSYQRQVTIPEGWNIFEIAQLLVEKKLAPSAKEFIDYVRDRQVTYSLLGEQRRSVEGYLFPNTYSYTRETSFQELVRIMVSESLKSYESLSAKYPKPTHLGRHEIFTLASIVEKETGAPEERPRIASVFLNRLKKGMKLQTDPTVIYGIADRTGELIQNIRKSDLLEPTDFNTYTNPGLPPGPIANPGSLALEAVFNPENTSYLFFVSQNEGRHFFSETYQEHLKAVQKYQLDPEAREGKSWRNMKTSPSSTSSPSPSPSP